VPRLRSAFEGQGHGQHANQRPEDQLTLFQSVDGRGLGVRDLEGRGNDVGFGAVFCGVVHVLL